MTGACYSRPYLEVADGGNLANVMAGYYKLFAPLTSPCQTRWVEYSDILTGTTLLAACLAACARLAMAATWPHGHMRHMAT